MLLQNKQIVRLSFVGLFIGVLFNVLLYRYSIVEEVILKQTAEYNNSIAMMYKEEIWNHSIKTISKLNKFGAHSLCQDADFINFMKESNKFFSSLKIKVTLFDKHANKFLTNSSYLVTDVKIGEQDSFYNKIFSKIDNYFLPTHSGSVLLSAAITGKTSHNLVSNIAYLDHNNFPKKSSFIISYIPIINSITGDFAVEGIIKITVDITDQWNSITYLERRILIAFIVVFLVFFAIIIYNTHQAQEIINQQFYTNQELKEAKKLVEMESSAKTDFLANVSHELRTPLNAIIGFSEIMLAKKLKYEQYQIYANDINQSGTHLLSIINDILDLSKAISGKLKVELIEINLNKFILSTLRFVQHRADKGGVFLINEVNKEQIIVIADPKRLKQALLNLLSNAVKFTHNGGSIKIETEKDVNNKLIYIMITDTGIGMNEKDIPKALSSFYQVDNSLSRKYNGTGLGLPLTKRLIEIMGGTFSLESALNKGTKATIALKYLEITEL